MNSVNPSGVLVETIVSDDPDRRNLSLESLCEGMPDDQLLQECEQLEMFCREETNLYARVRGLFFLYAIHRFILPLRFPSSTPGKIPFPAFEHLLQRRFRESIDCLLEAGNGSAPRHNDCVASGLAVAYYRLGLQNLANQVRQSVRSVRGNQWMFRVGHPEDYPLRIDPRLVRREGGAFPVLSESCAVRMDLTHSGWSDIFFLGMDFPECARVLNVSIDLALHGESREPSPPVEAHFRVIEEPVIRLVSIDLECSAEIRHLAEVFDFAKDYLGLLKAALIASGVVPPGLEGSGRSLTLLLESLVGEGRGIELVSKVNNIPKGSRLAVSTNLLAALISVCMRATGQTGTLTGALGEDERRLVAARAILGEWLGGSGGGWQDSGGVWPGIKVISGALAAEGDPEFGISRGRLLPEHRIIDAGEIPEASRRKLQSSLVLVHGGMAQNVGPILEMVTEKYLLRGEKEWEARRESSELFEQILQALRAGDMQTLGALTTRHFYGPLQSIIPWATNRYTEILIERSREALGDDFWGFWMLGGMSGGGMGFIVNPARQAEAKERILEIMRDAKNQYQAALPFAMDPVVYDFAINENGIRAELLTGGQALMPGSYYRLMAPALLRQEPRDIRPHQRAELERLGRALDRDQGMHLTSADLLETLLPIETSEVSDEADLEALLAAHGFDRLQHNSIRQDLLEGRIGLLQNRLPTTSVIEDVREGDVLMPDPQGPERELGEAALRQGQVGVISLAAGVGSRWTEGAGVVKALHPFYRFAGKHRSFIELHLAKSRLSAQEHGTAPVHFITTSYLTHQPIEQSLSRCGNFDYPGPVWLSPGQSIGLRMIPMIRDLRFAWEEMAQQMLDERQQKMRDSIRQAQIGWAQSMGEGNDYRDNVALQCLHPVGHWFEVPNLLLNGVLQEALQERPQLRYFMLHNIDTLGANLDPACLGLHIREGACLSFEVITRRIEDHGGGLARVDGRVRLVEGLALPREEDEFDLSYYNSATTWIDLDALLEHLGLSRESLTDRPRVLEAVRRAARKMPTYITIKEVKKRWGRGQEDIYPVCQFEKLWTDMSALPDLNCRFLAVPRRRGQQLKEQAQLDGWSRDGSADYVSELCAWETGGA
jgi:hypothetical protein